MINTYEWTIKGFTEKQNQYDRQLDMVVSLLSMVGGLCINTISRCLKLWIVPISIYTIFFPPMHHTFLLIGSALQLLFGISDLPILLLLHFGVK